MDEDFSRLTARDLLLMANEKQKVLEEKQAKQEAEFTKFIDNDFKELSKDVKDLIKFRSENVGVWKTVTGISVILGIIATLIALLK